MTLRTRVGLAGGVVVLLALAVASLVVYPAVRSIMRQQVDASLKQSIGEGDSLARQLKQKVAESGDKIPIDEPVELGSTLVQFVSGPVYPGSNRAFVEITQRDAEVADGTQPAYFQDTVYHGVEYRLLTSGMGKQPGGLMRVAHRQDDQAAVLASLAALLVALTLGGGLVAAVTARLAARRVLRPVRQLTRTVEHITATHDLTAPVDHLTGRDEIGHLGQAFAAMTTALDASMRAQRQLVADASHELRTPLTSLTTNLELLADGDGLRAPEAPALVQDAIGQARELRSLINNLVDLARYGKNTARTEDTRLDLVAKTVIAKAATRTSAPRFTSTLTPCLVHVDPDAIERAIGNLVENAVKWSPPDGEITITVADGEFAVTDEGPGIPAADLPFVFDRFYRSTQARSMPGSGLGLAIVRQVVETHGGHVAAEPLENGLRMRFRLPVVPGCDP